MSEMKKDRFDPDAEVFEDVHEDPPSLKLDEVNSNIHTSEQTQVPERTSKSDDILRWDDEAQLRSLGSDLSRMMEEQGYHPVILFGTNNSGKTSILMSLFATIASEPILDTGLSLCDPLLGSRTSIAKHLHKEAEHSFEVKTQAFLAGEKIDKTSTNFPFFIPVEFRPPDGRPPVKFAFLESNGEWYRPENSDGRALSEVERLYPALRGEIESFISSFQGGITFIYTAPVTQTYVYAAADNSHDSKEIGYAELAIKGVLQTYDRIRANGRSQDKHLMLVTKWDALSVGEPDRASGIEEDPNEVASFCYKRYGQAMTAFQGVNIDPHQRNINAYCAGMINERGLIRLKHDDLVRGVIASYPVRLWTYLYSNALSAAGQDPITPFREAPSPPAWRQALNRLLDSISGQ
tara:strand:+ start:28129 stop:29346 length:1218 start_codon:yes stop_codon:yes gene_type:complete